MSELRLSGNNFSQVPEALFPQGIDPGMTNLRVLAIDHNPLLTVHDNLATCFRIERLLLHNTPINKVNASIKYMYFLRELWISDTNITSLDIAVSQLPHIAKVVLDSEAQLSNFVALRRGLSSDKWAFTRPGEEAQVAADERARQRVLARARARSAAAGE